jgi:hypothetical protein
LFEGTSERGAIVPNVVVGLLVLLIGGFLVFSYVGPSDRIPGGYLFGEAVEGPVDDWSFVNQVPLCQVEVWGLLPHSVNLNCMADVGGALYLSCASCDGKRWSSLALENPQARLRIDGRVYPVTLTRVEDATSLDAAWHARALKTGSGPDTPRAEGWWSFRAQSR